MPTETDSTAEALQAQLHRMSLSIEELGARIARLARALDVNLEQESEINRVLSMEPVKAPAHERRESSDRRTASRMTGERRKAHMWQELRGMLVLRYDISARYVDQLGVNATRSILVNAQEQLVREGFRPGADGYNLQRMFEK